MRLVTRMARLPRIDVVGVPQHIVVRGVDRQPCFFANSDRSLYLEILNDAASRCNAAIHAFVLMTNHVHLLATGGLPGALSSMMQLVGLRYVRRVNGLYARTEWLTPHEKYLRLGASEIERRIGSRRSMTH